MLLVGFGAAVGTVNQQLLLYGDPEVWRTAPQGIAKEPRGGDSDQRNRMSLNDEGRSDERRIGTVVLLKGAVAHHDHRLGGALIIRELQQPSRVRADAEDVEVVPVHIFHSQRTSGTVP